MPNYHRMDTDPQTYHLRKFHNNVKSRLIETCAKDSNNILDIACGRGGDIFKFNKYNIQNVLGIDIEQVYINEAMKRFKKSEIHRQRAYEFKVYPKNPMDLCTNRTFEHISCQFALHYFFENENLLDSLCSFINANLEEEGYFFGTVLNGDNVHDILKQSDITNKCAMIKKNKSFEDKAKVGNAIDFYMHGTLYFGESSVSHEYLVYKSILVDKLSKFNIQLVSWKSFERYYKDSYELDDEYKHISFMYNTFIFKKKN